MLRHLGHWQPRGLPSPHDSVRLLAAPRVAPWNFGRGLPRCFRFARINPCKVGRAKIYHLVVNSGFQPSAELRSAHSVHAPAKVYA